MKGGARRHSSSDEEGGNVSNGEPAGTAGVGKADVQSGGGQTSKALSGDKDSDGTPAGGTSRTKYEMVIKVDFRNAYSDAVREKCVKRYPDGILGVYPFSVIDRLDAEQVKKLDSLLVKLRLHWQEPDAEGLVLTAGKSRDFFKVYSDEFLPFLKHGLFIDRINNEGASPDGGHVEARFSMDEWGKCEAGPIMVEITNYYPWFKKEDQYQYWHNGFHAVSICQFLEFCRYRGYLSFEKLEWLKR